MAPEDLDLALASLSLTNGQPVREAPYDLSEAPAEILIIIFQYLDYINLKAVGRTCRTFRVILKNPKFDVALFRQNYHAGRFAKLNDQLHEYGKKVNYQHPFFAVPDDYPISLHPALRASTEGGFAKRTFRYPPSPENWKWCRDEMMSQPALQEVKLCYLTREHFAILKNERGVTVGQVADLVRSRVLEYSSRRIFSGRLALDEQASTFAWRINRHELATLSTQPPALCIWLVSWEPWYWDL